MWYLLFPFVPTAAGGVSDSGGHVLNRHDHRVLWRDRSRARRDTGPAGAHALPTRLSLCIQVCPFSGLFRADFFLACVTAGDLRGIPLDDHVIYHAKPVVCSAVRSTSEVLELCMFDVSGAGTAQVPMLNSRVQLSCVCVCSKREKTHAARSYEDNVPADVKKRRLNEAIAVYQRGVLSRRHALVGTRQLVRCHSRLPTRDCHWECDWEHSRQSQLLQLARNGAESVNVHGQWPGVHIAPPQQNEWSAVNQLLCDVMCVGTVAGQ